MVLKWAFISDTGEYSAHSLSRSLGKQSSLSQYYTFTWKMVSKWPFISDTRKYSVCSLFRSPGTQNFELIEVYSEGGLEMAIYW